MPVKSIRGFLFLGGGSSSNDVDHGRHREDRHEYGKGIQIGGLREITLKQVRVDEIHGGNRRKADEHQSAANFEVEGEALKERECKERLEHEAHRENLQKIEEFPEGEREVERFSDHHHAEEGVGGCADFRAGNHGIGELQAQKAENEHEDEGNDGA